MDWEPPEETQGIQQAEVVRASKKKETTRGFGSLISHRAKTLRQWRGAIAASSDRGSLLAFPREHTHTFWKGGITEWQMIYMLTQAGTCAHTSLKARAHKRSIDTACQAVGLPGSRGSVAHLPKNPPRK